jgi:hypothetical protein
MTMKFKSFQEFVDDYEEHGAIDKVGVIYYPVKRLNPKQLQRYYLQYARKWEKAHRGGVLGIPDADSEDSRLSAVVRERDGGCRLLRVLSAAEAAEWWENHNGLGYILDAAHVFGKGAFPWMRFDERNVVTLNRFSHSCLDSGKSPLNGSAIPNEQRLVWWRRIVGEDWGYLASRARGRR